MQTQAIGNFRLVERIGRGGMGEVWLAQHHSVGTKVAVKLLASEVACEEHQIERFFNEARAVARIRHAGITKIFDVGVAEGRAYLVMEYLEGETVGRRLARVGKLGIDECIEIGRQVASVLDATHAVGITHRDLKPDNLFLVPDHERGERVKVLDFGIAKLTGTLAAGSPRTFGLLGTPAYMAPEQWGDPAAVDWRVDLYALGCLLFEIACGRPPFQPRTVADACERHLHEVPPRARSIAREVPVALDRLIAALLAKKPADRPPSMREVGRALDAIGDGDIALLATAASLERPSRRRRAAIAVAAVASAAVIGGLALAPAAAPAAAAPAAAAPALGAPPPETITTPDVAAEPPPPVAHARTQPARVASHPAAAREGAIDEGALRRILLAHARQFHDCYEPHARHDPSMTGHVVATFTIGLDGRATALSATGMTDEISGCVLSVIRTIVFPRPVGGTVPVTYPLSFEPEAPAALPGALEPAVAACAAKAGIHGTVIATINSNGDGSFAGLTLGPGLDTTPFAACVTDALRGAHFAAERSADTSLTVPLRFP